MCEVNVIVLEPELQRITFDRGLKDKYDKDPTLKYLGIYTPPHHIQHGHFGDFFMYEKQLKEPATL